MSLRTRIDPHTVVVLKFHVGDHPTWEDFRHAGSAILRAVGLELDGQTTVIKPNLTSSHTMPHPDTGVTVHPGAIAGMADWLRCHGAGPMRIVEHVNCEIAAPECWGGTGYVEMCRAEGIDLLGPEITLADCVDAPTPPPVRMLPALTVPRLLLEPNTVLLNVAKMKTHAAVITLSIKNTQGLVEWERRRFCMLPYRMFGKHYTRSRDEHEFWQEKLTGCHVDLIRALTSAGLPALHVVEGVIAREGSGFMGHGANRPMGLMLAGLDPVAVDTVGAWCMGFDPQKVIALRTAADAGLGTNRLDAIRVVSLDGDALVPLTDLSPYAAPTPFATYVGLAELDALRPYDRSRPAVAAA